MKRISKEELVQRLGGSSQSAVPPGFENANRSPAPAQSMQAVYGYVGRLVLKCVNQAPDQTSSVFQVLEALDTRTEELLPVIKWLEQEEYITVVERPRNGDWRLKPTIKAGKLLFESAS
jgi:hypothetical protein